MFIHLASYSSGVGTSHLINYIAHVVIRGIIYKFIFSLPIPVLIILGVVACIVIIKGRSNRRSMAVTTRKKNDDGTTTTVTRRKRAVR